jgi:hypothetical protein
MVQTLHRNGVQGWRIVIGDASSAAGPAAHARVGSNKSAGSRFSDPRVTSKRLESDVRHSRTAGLRWTSYFALPQLAGGSSGCSAGRTVEGPVCRRDDACQALTQHVFGLMPAGETPEKRGEEESWRTPYQQEVTSQQAPTVAPTAVTRLTSARRNTCRLAHLAGTASGRLRAAGTASAIRTRIAS